MLVTISLMLFNMYKWRKVERKKKRELAIDFDGVIHKYSKGFHDGTLYDPPVKGVKEVLTQLKKDWWIYIYTTRANTKKGKIEVEKWLDYNKIPYNEVTGKKPIAFAYIDDRAIYFINWSQAVKELNKRLKERLKK